MKTQQLMAYVLITITLIAISCNKDEQNTPNDKQKNEKKVDNYDRKALLTNLADNIIIPAFEEYIAHLKAMKIATSEFVKTPDINRLKILRTKWLKAYKAWQYVAMYDIGKAEAINLLSYTNIYPAEKKEIEKNIQSGNADLQISLSYDEQGFPALDYMINGLGSTDASIVAKYSDSKYADYLTKISNRLYDLSSQVLSDWKGTFRDYFVANSGSSATSSVNKLINDYVYYYEKYLRAAKIGNAAGVFSGNPDHTQVEAFYKKDVSKQLFMDGLSAMQDFFNGKYHNSDKQGESLKTYLIYLNTLKNKAKLDELINNQLNKAREKAKTLNDNFSEQVKNDNNKMLTTYDELQKVVVLLKVDMTQATNVKINYQDSDGD